MNEETKAYWAGLFDGEGWVRVEVKDGVRTGTGVLIVGIGSTFLSIPPAMKAAFGGFVTGTRIQSANGHIGKKPSCEWRATNHAAEEFLRSVYPYLRIKKRQAALAFKFRKIMTQTIRSGDAHRLELFKTLAAEIVSLNKGLALVETVKPAPRPAEKSQSTVPVQ